MTTDNKTLADVQPGGRVRLGDALLPCPFCGNDAEFVPYKNNGLTLKCKSMGCIQRHQRTLRYGIDWLRTSMTEHWNARVFSAHPSTGGQDALPPMPACRDRQPDDMPGYMESALDWVRDVDNCDAVDWLIDNHAAIRAALAARQPVGEPVEMSPEFTDTARAAIAWVLWHHQGGSSPVGQPLRFALGMGQHDRMTDYQIAEAKRFAAWAGATTEGFHRSAHAQAVDLGQFRYSVVQAINNVSYMTGYGPTYEKLTELLTLIDRHAVGNK